jgi:hypothetical protein
VTVSKELTAVIRAVTELQRFEDEVSGPVGNGRVKNVEHARLRAWWWSLTRNERDGVLRAKDRYRVGLRRSLVDLTSAVLTVWVAVFGVLRVVHAECARIGPSIDLAGDCSTLVPPFPQREVFPDDDGAMARALADPHLKPETKQELYAIFRRRLWPQEIVDPRTGLRWIYQRGRVPMVGGTSGF